MINRYALTYILFIFLSAGSLKVLAYGVAPVLRCLTATQNNVTLTWTFPDTLQSQMEKVYVYRSFDPTGGFTKIGTKAYPGNSYTEFGINPSVKDIYYYVVLEYSSGTSDSLSPPSDTLQVIRLQITNEADKTGFADLEWNHLKTPLISSSVPEYYVHRKYYASGTWAPLDTIPYPETTWSDPDKVCDDTIYYKIEMKDTTGCTSVSSIPRARIRDGIFPPAPLIDSVSVDTATGNLMVGWEESTHGDVYGYIVFHQAGNDWEVDTLVGGSSTFFMDSEVNGNLQQENYAVEALDTCGVNSPIDIIHKAVFLKASANACQRTVNLEWTSYEGWNNGVGEYVMYVSENKGKWKELTTLPSDSNSYAHTGLEADFNYCYMIRAKESGTSRTSSSNKLCLTLYVPDQPSVHYLSYATVKDDNKVELSWITDTTVEIKGFVIQRSSELSQRFRNLDSIPPSGDEKLTYIDKTASPTGQSYYYRVDVVSNCNVVIQTSNVAKTIHGKVSGDNERLQNTLMWNSYEGWDSIGTGVETYNVYRQAGNEPNPVLVTSLSSPDEKVIDDISDYYEFGGSFCYYIEAIEADGNPLDLKEISLSNKACVDYEPRMFVPNAFTPNNDGNNDIFKPEMAYVENEGYYFAVFNRWGNLVFETESVYEGWDGAKKGKLQSTGVYVYLVRMEKPGGEIFEKRGQVILISGNKNSVNF